MAQSQSQALQPQEKQELVSKDEKTVPVRYFVPATDIFETEDALESVRKMSSRYRNCFGAKQRASGAGLTMLGQCLAPAP